MIKRSECTCACHSNIEGARVVHCVPCCEPDGYSEYTPITVRANSRPSDPTQCAESGKDAAVGYVRSNFKRQIARSGLTTIYAKQHSLEDDIALYAHPPTQSGAEAMLDKVCENLLVLADGSSKQSATALWNAAVMICGKDRTLKIRARVARTEKSDGGEG